MQEQACQVKFLETIWNAIVLTGKMAVSSALPPPSKRMPITLMDFLGIGDSICQLAIHLIPLYQETE